MWTAHLFLPSFFSSLCLEHCAVSKGVAVVGARGQSCWLALLFIYLFLAVLQTHLVFYSGAFRFSDHLRAPWSPIWY